MFKFSNNLKNTLGQREESGAGFTLIEITFVLAIFLIIIGVTVSIFIAIVQHQRRILIEQQLLNQASYASEYMSKALRMAVTDTGGSCLGSTHNVYVLTHCNNGTQEPCQGIKFVDQSDSNTCTEFFLDDTTDPSHPVFAQIKNGAPAQNLLSEDFTIQSAKFILNGDQAMQLITDQDLLQPRVTILLDVEARESQILQKKLIQTTVSLRNLNVASTYSPGDETPVLTINKICVPMDDPGRFSLEVDGVAAIQDSNVPCGGTTGEEKQLVGPHVVGESAGLGTDLADYVSSISGDCDAAGNIVLAPGDNKTCTISNTRIP